MPDFDASLKMIVLYFLGRPVNIQKDPNNPSGLVFEKQYVAFGALVVVFQFTCIVWKHLEIVKFMLSNT